jgi:hypothetical protein
MILPEEFYIGILGLGFLYFLITFYVYSQTKGYVNPRINANLTGKRFIEEVDDNKRLKFDARTEKAGYITGSDTKHMVVAGSALRSLDGLIFQIHKDVGRTLTPEFIQAGNNLNRAGFKTYALAAELYKSEYFKKDWEEAHAAIKDKPALAGVIIDGVEQKIGLEIMKPIQQDNFTQDLSIVANFHKAKMSPVGFMNVIQQVKNEAEKNHNDGFTVEKAMKWVFVIVALCCGVAFALILANSAGLHLFGGAEQQVVQQVVQNVTNVTK